MPAWHLYTVLIDFEAAGVTRGQLMRDLESEGIRTQVHYIPVPSQPFYQRMGFKTADFPNAERYYAGAMTIPIYPSMSDAEQDQVIAALIRVLERLSGQRKD